MTVLFFVASMEKQSLRPRTLSVVTHEDSGRQKYKVVILEATPSLVLARLFTRNRFSWNLRSRPEGIYLYF